MTIKKRLFISNILMILVPIMLALATLAFAYGLLNLIFHGSLHAIFQEVEEAREVRFGESWQTMRAQILIVGILCIAGLVSLVYLTNQFLIKFVFQSIEAPLRILAHGVRQIRDGNLSHRISYASPDEFFSVCEDFNEMAGRLKASVDETLKNDEARKELIAGISHDLRSPLTSIKAYAEGLIDGVAATPEAQKAYLEVIKSKADDIIKMVSQLFLFSKMDMGGYPVNPEKLDIANEISDFVNAAREGYMAKGLSVFLGPMPKGLMINADPTQLRSVFTNVLDNSAKYKAKDMASAYARCEGAGGYALIYFEDDGPGAPDGSLERLFDVFYRGDSSRGNPEQGSGLGLAIARKMVNLMNGAVLAENRAEGGLRIIIKIPEFKGAKTA